MSRIKKSHHWFASLLFLVFASSAPLSPARAGDAQRGYGVDNLPFNRRISNIAPLFFGMNAIDVTQALGVPLVYVKGLPGNETFYAPRNDGGSGFFPRNDRLYLQFRRGRLTGIKGDWGRNWMWR